MKIDVSQGISVGGFIYTIHTGPQVNMKLGDSQIYGQCLNREHSLEISTEWSEQQQSATFIHESLEAVDHVWLSKKEKLTHEQIIRLAYGLHQIMEGLNIRFLIPKRLKK